MLDTPLGGMVECHGQQRRNSNHQHQVLHHAGNRDFNRRPHKHMQAEGHQKRRDQRIYKNDRQRQGRVAVVNIDPDQAHNACGHNELQNDPSDQQRIVKNQAAHQKGCDRHHNVQDQQNHDQRDWMHGDLLHIPKSRAKAARKGHKSKKPGYQRRKPPQPHRKNHPNNQAGRRNQWHPLFDKSIKTA
ncbi:hypothetical protein SDC9_147554 [bioreactor metagenome]|uniref:Uncharacterized protein n=1 Tax=bioreactor metagenome TaxID=1076179 RepID=A0A645EG86_9ZZZZ